VKLRIEVSGAGEEDEVIIRCARVDDTVQKLQAYILGLSDPKLAFYKGQEAFYFPLDKILFFATEGEQVYAHTENDAFQVKHRLYELEAILPHTFARAAKGVIVNTGRIYAIGRNLATSNRIQFPGTHKQVYVSRHYYKALKAKINEWSESL